MCKFHLLYVPANFLILTLCPGPPVKSDLVTYLHCECPLLNSTKMLPIRLLLLCFIAGAAAQFGRRNMREDMPSHNAPKPSDVDIAMAGWEQLSQNPDKMKDVMDSFKDPEVMAKAQEMLKDPTYMAQAKAKLAQIQAKAQAQGYLDENGQPVPGMASAAAAAIGQGGQGMDALAAMMGGAGGAGGAGGGAAQEQGYAEWELENANRYRAGEMNDAELGMANLKGMARDPAALKSAMDMLKDPAAMAEVKKMMADPSFKAQAEAMVNQMKAEGGMPDLSKLAAMGGMGGMGGGMGSGMSELERLRAENAALRAGRGMRDEL